MLIHPQFKWCIAYNYSSRNQEGQNIDIHKIRGPGGGLMFTDTGNDGNILACIGSVKKVKTMVQLLVQKRNRANALYQDSMNRRKYNQRDRKQVLIGERNCISLSK